MAYVWENSKQTASKLLMLLALADAANDQGYCWPAVGTLALKTRMSERNARYLLRQLEESGDISTVEPGGKHQHDSSVYFLQGGKDEYGWEGRRGAKKRQQGGNLASSGGQPVAPNPSISVLEPSIPKPLSRKEAEDITRKTSAMIEAGLRVSENKSWTVPANAGGADSLGDKLLTTFLQATGISKDVMPKKKLGSWRKQLSEVSSNWQVTPEQADQALVAMFDPDGQFGFKTYSSPLQQSFVNDWELYLGQMASKGKIQQKGDREADAQADKEAERTKRKMERWKAQHGIG